MVNEDTIVAANYMADLLNVTERRIQQLAKEDVLKREGRGQYRLMPSIRGYIKFIQECAYGDRGIGTDLQGARARESKLKGDKLELEIAEAAGKLVLVAELEPLLDAWGTVGCSEVKNAFNKVIADIEGSHSIKIDIDLVSLHVEAALKAIGNYPQGKT